MRALVLLLALQLEPVYSREAVITCHPACVRLDRGWFDGQVCCESTRTFDGCAARVRASHPDVVDVRQGRCGGQS